MNRSEVRPTALHPRGVRLWSRTVSTPGPCQRGGKSTLPDTQGSFGVRKRRRAAASPGTASGPAEGAEGKESPHGPQPRAAPLQQQPRGPDAAKQPRPRSRAMTRPPYHGGHAFPPQATGWGKPVGRFLTSP